MKFSRFLFLLLLAATMAGSAFAQGGFYIQHRVNTSKNVFIQTGTRVNVKLRNGKQVSGKMTEADSLGITGNRKSGQPVRIDYYSLAKIKVYNPHEYFKLTKRIGSGSGAGCLFYSGGNCDLVALLAILAAYTVIAAGEGLIDAIADASNDITYDVVNVWKIPGVES